MKMFSLLLALLLFSSCGERQRRTLENSTQDELIDGLLPNPIAENNCTIEPFGIDHLLTCDYLSLLIEGNVLANAVNTGTELVLTASKKNSGTGGSQWVDVDYEFETPVLLALPSTIPASGDAGNGQKLYILFNNNIDCAWFSHASNEYRNRRCFRGAARLASDPSGFTGGEELMINEVEDVEKVEMHVNGAAGSGIVTTASAVFVIN